tara:strand:+ start:48 stop:638 length:591 start_codon:yes stop_codon:yes gene_type:complete
VVINAEKYFKEIQKTVENIDQHTVNKVIGVWRVFQNTNLYPSSPSKTNFRLADNRIFIIGNGGSCAIAEHISTDLNKRCKVKAYTLSNNSLQTALTNDYGQENAFVEWLKINQFNKDDYLVAISSSGKSKNILNALEHAYDCLGSTLSIFGMDGENIFPEKSFEHDYIHIDNYNYGVIELTSEIILHGIVEELVIE